jgi:hypothetical protein
MILSLRISKIRVKSAISFITFQIFLSFISIYSSYAQSTLPVAIGQTRIQVIKEMHDYKSITLSDRERQEDSTAGWRIDSAYDGIKFHGLSGYLFITFDLETHSTVTNLMWQAVATDFQVKEILNSLKKQYGGMVTKYDSWYFQTNEILREAIYFQRDLNYRESSIEQHP